MKLTRKQEAFALAYIKTGNASAAYRTVYDAGNMAAPSINVAASRVLKNAKVALRVAELRAPALAKAAMDAQETILEIVRIARAVPDEPLRYADKLRALDMLAKRFGIYERDNKQRGPNLALRINVVGGPPREAEPIDVTPIESRRTD